MISNTGLYTKLTQDNLLVTDNGKLSLFGPCTSQKQARHSDNEFKYLAHQLSMTVSEHCWYPTCP